jgi:hypothetical protein
MIKNLKNVLYFFGSFSMFLSCSSEIENPNHNTKPEIAIDSINSEIVIDNIKPEIAIDSLETVLVDSILEIYREQKITKKGKEISFEILKNPFDEKNNFIKVISSNQPSKTWGKCDTSSFYCSNFYFTKYLINCHPLFRDNNGNYLFFEGDEWIFYNQFPTKEIIEKIANDKIIIPNEDKICYCYNSFDPARYSAWISEEMTYNRYSGDHDYKNKLTLGKFESQVFKSLIWDDSYNGDYIKFEKQNTKNKIFKILEENYELMTAKIKTDDSNKLNFVLVPDSNNYGNIYDKGLILKSYIKANYPIDLDSSNYIKINDEKQDRFGYTKFDSLIAGPIKYVFNSEKLEMEFDSELKIIFPTCNHSLINNLLYCLGITLGNDEYGSCGEHKNKETYDGEWETFTIKDTNNQTILTYSYSAAGC